MEPRTETLSHSRSRVVSLAYELSDRGTEISIRTFFCLCWHFRINSQFIASGWRYSILNVSTCRVYDIFTGWYGVNLPSWSWRVSSRWRSTLWINSNVKLFFAWNYFHPNEEKGSRVNIIRWFREHWILYRWKLMDLKLHAWRFRVKWYKNGFDTKNIEDIVFWLCFVIVHA